MRVGVSSWSESFFHSERGIKLMLAPRSAKAKHYSSSEKSQGMRNLPSLELDNFLDFDCIDSGCSSNSSAHSEEENRVVPFGCQHDNSGLFEDGIHYLLDCREGDGEEVVVLTFETIGLFREIHSLNLFSMIVKASRGVRFKRFPPAATFRES
nr:hypothetical protein [Tanacetum cinerariifolium]